ncbi:MAG: hypothetical protein U9Q68_06385 [Euryarchaeota archaeon]|nr:hypothetical protein [Euryarchaeota archaeon]
MLIDIGIPRELGTLVSSTGEIGILIILADIAYNVYNQSELGTLDTITFCAGSRSSPQPPRGCAYDEILSDHDVKTQF